jgi:hypothetical protein
MPKHKLHMQSVITLTSVGSTVVKHMTLHPKSKDLNPAVDTRREPLAVGEKKWQKTS